MAKTISKQSVTKTAAKTAAKTPAKKAPVVKAKPASAKPVAKASVKAPVKAAAKAVKPAAKSTVADKVTKVAKEIVKQVSKVVAKSSTKEKLSKTAVKEVAVKEKVSKKEEQVVEKPALMTKKGKAESKDPKDQGELLIEKAREEMAKINADAKQAEKASKVKPIKIERGNSADEKAKWQELNKRHGKEKAQVYKMTEVFESMKPIQHKVLGWGFVLTNENNRLEVLFENGIKMLISNYKPS